MLVVLFPSVGEAEEGLRTIPKGPLKLYLDRVLLPPFKGVDSATLCFLLNWRKEQGQEGPFRVLLTQKVLSLNPIKDKIGTNKFIPFPRKRSTTV